MCGGTYQHWETPRQLSVVKGEVLIERTIRLLKENGITNIYISSHNSIFDKYAPRLEHENNFECTYGKKISGHWVNAFYPTDEPTCYIFGDVYFSDAAIKKIVETQTNDILFFGSKNINRPEYFKKWQEPFAFKVFNQKKFKECIEICKRESDLGHTNREPISWELYRVINNYNINQHIIDKGYVAIDDYTTDIDCQNDIAELEKIL